MAAKGVRGGKTAVQILSYIVMFEKFASKFGVKVKIIIGLLQVLDTMGPVFSLQYPPIFEGMLRFCGSLVYA